jgi:hypothetical protein
MEAFCGHERASICSDIVCGVVNLVASLKYKQNNTEEQPGRSIDHERIFTSGARWRVLVQKGASTVAAKFGKLEQRLRTMNLGSDEKLSSW